MIKLLFMIHDLGRGGAEKVLVNLVNNMDHDKFDITVCAMFGGGVNEQFLSEHIKYRALHQKCLPGNSHMMKLLSPAALHRRYIREKYDIEIAYLEGPSARVISGCRDPKTKLVSWIHVEQHTMKTLAASFRSSAEARRCYERFDQTVCVSEYVKQDFCSILGFDKPCRVLYNTVESDKITEMATEPAPLLVEDGRLRLIAVGTLKPSKGFDRLLRIVKRLTNEGYRIHLYILGEGPMKSELEQYAAANGIADSVTLLGYDTNPYRYVAKCDLFVCASHAEGFSTAATEALIVGTPVLTTEVSGMKEMLGENNEFGVVTENNEEALYLGLKRLLDDEALLAHYRAAAIERSKSFKTEETVKAVERMLEDLNGIEEKGKRI